MANTIMAHEAPPAPAPAPAPGTASISRPGSVTYCIPTQPPANNDNDNNNNTSLFSSYSTRIHLPPSSQWTSGLHWHNQTTEYLSVVRGAIFVTLGTRTSIHRASSSSSSSSSPSPSSSAAGHGRNVVVVVRVDAGVRHNWGRAEEYLRTKRSMDVDVNEKSEKSEKSEGIEELADHVVVEEWTLPCSMSKPLFFWNLNGVIITSSSPSSCPKRALQYLLGTYWTSFQLFIIFHALDNYPVFVGFEPGFGRLGRRLEFALTWTVLWACSLVGRVVGVEAVSEERTPRSLWEAWVVEDAGGRKRK
ncbi:hypothetical protein K504DRAFT_459545 [Pleomassaria siparia CBS 279.74]|uniref:Uncharacterized protein n=1 Tax=Pleomassaria siparia CBS 279.74 TaxID=1314801 RepID=A0A6G1K156_9PLEO|nr:hypothetical protein K504DRAFT_459545 [Pleomassaria siparia CBS 279.74]